MSHQDDVQTGHSIAGDSQRMQNSQSSMTQARAEALYTAIFGLAAPYGDYLQPPFDEGSCLTPIDWVVTISSVGLGAFLLEFLKELGKKSAGEALELLKVLRSTTAIKNTERMVVNLLVSEVFPASQSIHDRQTISKALVNTFSAVRTSLIDLGFPDSAADELSTEIVTEVTHEIKRYLDECSGEDPTKLPARQR